jgi:hypothetical protein
MQKITNMTNTLQHLPGSHAPDRKATRVLPEETITYDLEGLLEARPKLALSFRGVFISRPATAPKAAPAVVATPVEAAPVQADPPPAQTGRTDEYAILKTSECLELIEVEKDVDVLTAWQMVETRKGVGAALTARLAELASA